MKTTPHVFVIAADGTLAYNGAMDNRPQPFGDPRTAKNYVNDAVTELLAGKGKSLLAELRPQYLFVDLGHAVAQLLQPPGERQSPGRAGVAAG